MIRKVGDRPLKEVLASLGGWPVATPDWRPPHHALEVLLGRLRELSEGLLFQQWVGPDDKNSSVNILQVQSRAGSQQLRQECFDDFESPARARTLFCGKRL